MRRKLRAPGDNLTVKVKLKYRKHQAPGTVIIVLWVELVCFKQDLLTRHQSRVMSLWDIDVLCVSKKLTEVFDSF